MMAREGGCTETGTRYLTPDHLGSVRLETDSTGAVTKCLDYAPFGESLAGNYGRTASCFTASTSANAPQFTGQYRDQETQIDFFEARFYASAQGRFLSPDAPLIDQDPSDPQSWNLYAYVRNNPLSNVDPTGTCSVKKPGEPATDDPGEPCVTVGDNALKVTARPDDVNYDWSTLTREWIRGNTLPVENFGENDTYTKQLRSSQIVQRKVAAARTLAGQCNPQFPAGSLNESLARYPKSYRTGKFLTDGFDFAFNRNNPNTAASSLGSFAMSYQTIRSDAAAGTATIGFRIENPKSFASLTRNPATGYDSTGNRRPGWLGGAMQDLTEVIAWEEIVDFPACGK